MSNFKHTPGPWIIYDDSNDGKTNSIEIVALCKTVAHIYHSDPEEDLPNALLIAAAPELLKALIELEEAARCVQAGEWPKESIQSERTKAHAVIAKATGENK